MTLNSVEGEGATIVHVFIDDSLAIVSVPLTVKRL